MKKRNSTWKSIVAIALALLTAFPILPAYGLELQEIFVPTEHYYRTYRFFSSRQEADKMDGVPFYSQIAKTNDTVVTPEMLEDANNSAYFVAWYSQDAFGSNNFIDDYKIVSGTSAGEITETQTMKIAPYTVSKYYVRLLDSDGSTMLYETTLNEGENFAFSSIPAGIGGDGITWHGADAPESGWDSSGTITASSGSDINYELIYRRSAALGSEGLAALGSTYKIVYEGDTLEGYAAPADDKIYRAGSKARLLKRGARNSSEIDSSKAFRGWVLINKNSGNAEVEGVYLPGECIDISAALDQYALESDGVFELHFVPKYENIGAPVLTYHSNFPSDVDGVTAQTLVVQKTENESFTLVGTEAFTLDNYEIESWRTTATAEEGSKTYELGATIAIDKTSENHLYAVWKASTGAVVNYYVDYYKEQPNGTYVLDENARETFSGRVGQTRSAAGKGIAGYEYDASNANNASSIVLTPDASGNVLKFYYKLKSYKIAFAYSARSELNASDVSLPSSGTTFRLGDTVIIGNDTTAESTNIDSYFRPGDSTGYQFYGWQLSEEALAAQTGIYGIDRFEITADLIPVGDTITLYGEYRLVGNVPYTVEYYRETLTSGVYEKDVNYSRTEHAKVDETVSAYIYQSDSGDFAGFVHDESKASGESGKVPNPVDGSLTLKVYYNRKTYNLTYSFQADTGAEVAADIVKQHRYGESVSFSEVTIPTKAGYTFTGWRNQDTDLKINETADGITEMPAKDAVIYGYYTAASNLPVRIAYYLENADGTWPDTASVTEVLENGRIGVEYDATDGAKEIEHFILDESKTGEMFHKTLLQGETDPEKAPTLSLYYRRNTHTLSFVINGGDETTAALVSGEDYQTKTYRYGQEITLPAKPVTNESVWLFRGWRFNDPSSMNIQNASENDDGTDVSNQDTLWKEGIRFLMPDRDVSVFALFVPPDSERLTYTVREHLDALNNKIMMAVARRDENNNIVTDANGKTVYDYVLNTADSNNSERIIEHTYTGYLTEKLHVNASSENGYDILPYDVHEGFTLDLTRGRITTGDAGLQSDSDDRVFDLYYRRNSYTVTYTFGSGAPTADEFALPTSLNQNNTHEYGEHVFLTDGTPAQDDLPAGYHFDGWSLAQLNAITDETGARYFIMPNRAVGVTCNFTATNVGYSVHYYFEDLVGGGFTENTDAMVSHEALRGSEVSIGKADEKEFEGFYYTEGSGSYTSVRAITLVSDESLNVLKRYYRRSTFKVGFNYPDYAPSEATVENLPADVNEYRYGESVEMPSVTLPEDSQYAFQWIRPEGANITVINGSFEMPAMDLTFVGQFSEKASYTVEHYYQNLPPIGGTASYPRDAEGAYIVDEVETRYGGAGQTERAQELMTEEGLDGFTVDGTLSTMEATIAADGSTVIRIFYLRNRNPINYGFNGTQIPAEAVAPTDDTRYYYGQTVGNIINAVPAPELSEDNKEKFEFEGWKVDGAAVSDDFTMPGYALEVLGSFKQTTQYAGNDGTTKVGGGGFGGGGSSVVAVDGLSEVENDSTGGEDEGEIVRDTETVDPETGRKGDPVHGYVDVGWGDWYAEAVDYISESGIMTGTSIAEFSPKEVMNRAMMVTVMYRIAQMESDTDVSPNGDYIFGLNDINVYGWYTEALEWGLETGVVTGYKDGSYRPEEEITREQLAVVLYRYGGDASEISAEAYARIEEFKDYETIGKYAREAIAWCVDKGIITGRTNGNVDPKGSAIRAEVAAMIQRYMGRN